LPLLPCLPIPTPARAATSSLVGAWSFDESSGTTAFDSSGNSNNGAISGATRVPGKFGNALQFDGVNDMVSVADANSLDLTSGMTLEAWIKPSALGTMWRTVAIKEQTKQLAYALYAGNGKGKPSGHVFTTRDTAVAGTGRVTPNTWTHIAATYDGKLLRLYKNGVEIAEAALATGAVQSNRPLRFGGNSVWNEWFKGAIDEMRIYNRALSPAELQTDRTTSVTPTQMLARMVKVAKPKAKKASKAKKRRKASKRPRAHTTRWIH
jgi:hypothetical protein